jgi:hypothetical protein
MKHKLLIFALIFCSGIKLFAQNNKIESDFFDIMIIPANTKVWDEKGSGASRELRIWSAQKQTGYFLFGNQLTRNDIKDGKYTSTIALKPKNAYLNQKLIVEPSSFEEVWNSKGTTIDPRIYIWRAICPEGYVSLGMVITSYSDVTRAGTIPNGTDCGCIKKEVMDIKTNKSVDLVKEAIYDSENESTDDKKIGFWDAGGTSENVSQVSLWRTRITGATEQNNVMLTSNSFFASKLKNITPFDKPYALNLKFDIDLNKKVNIKTPEISPPFPPDEADLKSKEVTNEYTVPFFAVKDDKYPSMLDQFLACPYYSVTRKTRYKYVNHFSCPLNGSKTSFSYAITNSVSKEDNWQNAVGISLGYSFSVGVEGSYGAGKVSATSTFSVEASYNRSWGGSTTKTEETTSAYDVELEPGQSAVILQEINEFQVFRVINGKKENTPYAQYIQGEKSHIPLYFNDPEREKSKINTDNVKDSPKGNIGGITAYGKYFVELKPDGRLIINTLDDNAKICNGENTAKANQQRVNVALGKTATQSSTLISSIFPNGGHASYAVDGNIDGNYINNSVTHTNAEVDSWWVVDLGQVYDIDEIVVWNRTDCCAERLDNFVISTSLNSFTNSAGISGLIDYGRQGTWAAGLKSITIKGKGKARYLRINSSGPNVELSLAEVQVFAK